MLTRILTISFLLYVLIACQGEKTAQTAENLTQDSLKKAQEQEEKVKAEKRKELEFIQKKKQQFAQAKLGESEKKLAENLNHFGLDLFQKMATAPDSNVLISPFSIYTALGMVYVGSAGKTKQEFEKVMYLNPNAQNKEGFFNLLGHIYNQNSEHSAVNIANSIWVDKDTQLKTDYQQLLQKYFATEGYQADFSQKEIVKQINDWVKQETNNTIPQIIDEIDKNTELILLNALYFKGEWLRVFDKELTKEEDFYLHRGKKVKTKLMQNRGYFSYFENGQIKMLALPYKSANISMYFILPHQPIGLPQLKATLTANQLQTWLSQMKYEEMKTIKIPKFQFDYSKFLNDYLKKLGLKTLFDNQASPLNLATTPLFVNQVLHKSFVNVTEESTEASAITEIEMAKDEPKLPPNSTFIADHPFLFFIRDDESGAILFMGQFVKPK